LAALFINIIIYSMLYLFCGFGAIQLNKKRALINVMK